MVTNGTFEHVSAAPTLGQFPALILWPVRGRPRMPQVLPCSLHMRWEVPQEHPLLSERGQTCNRCGINKAPVFNTSQNTTGWCSTLANRLAGSIYQYPHFSLCSDTGQVPDASKSFLAPICSSEWFPVGFQSRYMFHLFAIFLLCLSSIKNIAGGRLQIHKMTTNNNKQYNGTHKSEVKP